MSASIAFDQASAYYDRTRQLPPEQAETLKGALIQAGDLKQAGAVLEVGIGTGRISIPLLNHDINVYGVDLSAAMLREMRRKAPLSKVLRADAVALPFHKHTFATVIMVHVLHLIAGWQTALFEVQRVLKSGGVLLHLWNRFRSDDVHVQVQDHFFAKAAEMGWAPQLPGASDREAVVTFWQDHSWSFESILVVSWQEHLSVNQLITWLGRRYWSSTWHLTEGQLGYLMDDLTLWIENLGIDIREPLPQTRTLILDVVVPS